MKNTIKINVYRDGGTWYGARWLNGEWDGCDELGIPDAASDREAIQAARDMALINDGERDVTRVPDPKQEGMK